MKWRKLTRTAIARQMQGGQCVAPGIYLDRAGNPHFSIEELLAFVHLEDTPANRATVTRTVEEWITKNFPGVEIIAQDLETDG